jgi:acylaminoacyl-peptidase
VLQLEPAHQEGGGSDIGFEAVVVRQRSAATPGPAVLYLHGGPHSAYVASYISSVAYLAALGYVVIIVSRTETAVNNASPCLPPATCKQTKPLPDQGHLGNAFDSVAPCLQPNYRGSTGYGEDSIQSLPGRAGTNDVADCMTALQAAIDQGQGLFTQLYMMLICCECRP